MKEPTEKYMIITEKARPIANPLIVLREEFDDWAILFDPDTGNVSSLNPVGVFVWQLLDGSHSVEDILKKLKDDWGEVPREARDHLNDFIQSLVEQGLANLPNSVQTRQPT
jgi:SynChlorMet cassette protein ScmD